jgi:hypothetical protein
MGDDLDWGGFRVKVVIMLPSTQLGKDWAKQRILMGLLLHMRREYLVHRLMQL